MHPFTVHTGTAVPLRRSDVDTDQILPGKWLRRISRDGFGDALFENWRTDPDFVLNQPEYQEGTILVAGTNFGTGSSREFAVRALQNYGFKAVLSPRFADIFRGNTLKNGLLSVELPQGVIDRLWDRIETDPTTQVTVDLVQRQVSFADQRVPFEIDDYNRRRLLEGLDDIDMTMQHLAEIERYERAMPSFKPLTKQADRSSAPASRS